MEPTFKPMNNTPETKAKVGLAKHAYSGAPEGIAQVDLSNPEELTPKPRWEYKTKKTRRQEIIDSL